MKPPPLSRIYLKVSYELVFDNCCLRISLVRSRRLVWISFKIESTESTNVEQFTVVFCMVSLLTSSNDAFLISRGPKLILSGTPLTSHSLNFHPEVYSSRSSTKTLIPDFLNTLEISCAFSLMTLASLSLNIGTITICTGAMYGGSNSPLSSPCIITSAPMRRHEIPHEVCQ